MWRIIIITILLHSLTKAVNAQRYLTRKATVSFQSLASKETITATNNQGIFILDTGSLVVEAAVLMRGFTFRKALMQEHFNENYVESEKYPKSIFKGRMTGTSPNWEQDGTYTVTVEGTLNLHGQTNPVSTEALINIKSGKVSASTSFTIKLSDYRISIPAVVTNNINNTITISFKTGELQHTNQ